VILHSSSEALLLDLLNERVQETEFWRFDWFSWITWVVCASVAAIVLMGFGLFRMNQRLQMLSAILMSTPRAVAYNVRGAMTSLEQVTSARPVVTNENMSVISLIISAIRWIDGVLIAMIIMASLTIVGILWVRLRRANHPHSYLYVELAAGQLVKQLRLLIFPDATQYFTVKVSRTGLTLKLMNFGCFGVVQCTYRKWRIVSNLTGRHVDLPAHIFIFPWSISKYRSILTASDYTITPIVINSHQYVFLERPGETDNGDQIDEMV
jgi:hypothetical protein